MKLLTKELERKLPPLGSTEGVPFKDKVALIKYFSPTSSWTWYVIEGERTDSGDVEFFGLVDGQFVEAGSFCLSELVAVRGPYGLGIERDMYWTPKPLGKLMESGQLCGIRSGVWA